MGPAAPAAAAGAPAGAARPRAGPPGAPHRGRARPPAPPGVEGGARLLRRDGRQLQRPLLRPPGGHLQPHLAARLHRPGDRRPREGRRMREGAPGGARPLPPQPLRLPDPLLHLPPELPLSAPHRGRRQPELLAHGAALPRRRRLLHPPHLRGQRALQDGLPEVPHLLDPRGLHAGVLHRGRADADGEDPHPEARHAVGHPERLRPGRAARPLLRAHLHALRAHSGGGGLQARGRRRGEGARVARRASPRAQRAQAPLRDGLRELCGPDLPERPPRPRPRALRGRARRPGGGGGEAPLHPAPGLPPAARRERRRGGGRHGGQRHGAPRRAARRLPHERVPRCDARALRAAARPGGADHGLARAQRSVGLQGEPPLARGGRAGRAPGGLGRRRPARAGLQAHQPRLLQEQHDPLLPGPLAAHARAPGRGAVQRAARAHRLVARPLPLGVPAPGARRAGGRDRALARVLPRGGRAGGGRGRARPPHHPRHRRHPRELPRGLPGRGAHRGRAGGVADPAERARAAHAAPVPDQPPPR